MRTLEIRDKGTVFSHEPGVKTLIPRTFLALEAFPARLRIFSLKGDFEEVLDFEGLGKLKDFTVLTDWKKGFCQVSGKSANGFFRYRVGVNEDASLELFFDKLPDLELPGLGLSLLHNGKPATFQQKQSLLFPLSAVGNKVKTELSFGNHKEHQWPLLKRREDLSEILPFWFRAGALLPTREEKPFNKPSMLESLENAFSKSRTQIETTFIELFQAGFEGMLVPRAKDEEYRGFKLPPVAASESPLDILSFGKKKIEEMAIAQIGDDFYFLQHMPSGLPCGKLVHFPIKEGEFFFEWSKGVARRLFIDLKEPLTTQLHFKGIRSYTLSRSIRGKKQLIKNGQAIHLDKPGWYFLDHFQK